MNKIVLFFSLLCLISFPAFAVDAIVSYILDGDTFAAKVNLDKDIQISVRVRILDIDAPELKGGCEYEIDLAKKSKKRLEELLPIDSVVKLSGVKDDKYLGRIDAKVKNFQNVDVSSVLIKENLARSYDGGKRKSWCE